MKRKIIFCLAVFLLALQAYAVFAADYDEDFDEALEKNNLTKAEDILRKRSGKMDLAMRLERIILNNIKGFNSNNAISVAQMLIRYGANVNTVKRVSFNDGSYYDAPLLYITVRSTGLNKDQTVQMINLLCHSGSQPDARILSVGGRHTALMYASIYKTEWNMAYTKALIENGANVNLQNDDGDTVLMLQIDDFDVFKYLVDNKADLNIRNKKGQTILILAAEKEKTNMVTYLVEHGANINLRDNNGMTAASIAYDKGNIDIYDYLKGHGARDFEPRQVTQQPQQQTAPQPSTTNVYVQPSAPAPAPARTQAPATPTLQTGRYACSGTNVTMELLPITRFVTLYSGSTTVGNGQYNINGNNITITIIQASGVASSMQGKTYAYTITSDTSFSGSGESWYKR